MQIPAGERTLLLLASTLAQRGRVLQEVLGCTGDTGREASLVVTVSCGVISPPGKQASDRLVSADGKKRKRDGLLTGRLATEQ